MMELSVYIEINGKRQSVGVIRGSGYGDGEFSYSEEYIDNPDHRPISLSLPFQKEAFSADKTRNFFEGLLPEGFSRKSLARWIHVDENDYLTIIAHLGKECLGAIQILDGGVTNENDHRQMKGIGDVEPDYRQLTSQDILLLAKEGATKATEILSKTHLSLTGASGKVGLYYDENKDQWYLPLGTAPSTHIVKQSHVRLRHIVTNEQLALQTARRLGIDVPESFILRTDSDFDEDILFATKRYDRVFSPNGKIVNGHIVPNRLHQEDFAQAMGINALDKYEKPGDNYLRKMFQILAEHSSNPIEDQLKLWDIIIFNSLIGNTDCHIKNFGLLYSADMESIRLSPAYDLVSTIVYDECTRNLAFRIGDQYDITRISRDDFIKASQECGLGTKMAMGRYDRMLDRFEACLTDAAEELWDLGFKEADELKEKIMSQCGRL